MADQYEQDEFDQIAAAGGPVGVHRAPRPWWMIVVTPLVVFVIAGLVAYLVAQILWNSEVDSSSSASPTPSISASAEPSVSASPSVSATASASASPEPEPEVTETPSETPEPEPEPDLALPVAVLNGTITQGYASDTAQVLLDAGFTSVTAANLTGERPAADRVVYAEEDQRVTAEEAASLLGLDTVEQGTPTSDADIEVQLVETP